MKKVLIALLAVAVLLVAIPTVSYARMYEIGPEDVTSGADYYLPLADYYLPLADFADSLTAAGLLSADAVRDSVNAGIADDATHMLKAAFDDSSKAWRVLTTAIPLASASWDSTLTGTTNAADSLLALLTNISPLGTRQTLWVKSVGSAGSLQKAYANFRITPPDAFCAPDSLLITIWGESALKDTSAVLYYVLADSSDGRNLKAAPTYPAVADTLRPSAPRTVTRLARYIGGMTAGQEFTLRTEYLCRVDSLLVRFDIKWKR